MPTSDYVEVFDMFYRNHRPVICINYLIFAVLTNNHHKKY